MQNIWGCAQDSNTEAQKPRAHYRYVSYNKWKILKMRIKKVIYKLKQYLTRSHNLLHGLAANQDGIPSTTADKEAVYKNRHFEKPMRLDFHKHIQEALRITKERIRQKRTRQRGRNAGQQRNVNPWNKKSEEEILDEPRNNE